MERDQSHHRRTSAHNRRERFAEKAIFVANLTLVGMILAASLTIAMAIVAALTPSAARAECLTLASGQVAYDVAGCKLIEPESVFDTTKSKYAFIADLDPAGKKAFLDSYRGLLLKGKVVKSAATTKGVAAESNVLTGQDVFMYVPPPLPVSCEAALGKRLAGNMRQACCDGNGDPPCLLNTEYVLASPQVVGGAKSASGDEVRQRAKKSAAVRAGDKAFGARKYKEAIKHYEAARANGDLDVAGNYRLAYAYRETDSCRQAIPPLKTIQQMDAKKQVWADEEKTVRSAIFLLARCYAKINDPSPAVLILNAYLLEPKKYSYELRASLRHKDFGWIHTSKEYREYKKAAEKKLRK